MVQECQTFFLWSVAKFQFEALLTPSLIYCLKS